MSLRFDWINALYDRAVRDGDHSRLQMIDFYTQACRVSDDRPDERLNLLQAGHALAVQLNEPWCVMFFEGWKITTFLTFKQDALSALDLAARAALEVNKPIYQGSPFRASINLQLVAAYRLLDPVAHEPAIRAAFNVIREQGAAFEDFGPYYWQQWAYFLEALDDPHALTAAWGYVAAARNCPTEDSRAHYGMSALNLVCELLVGYEPATARAQMAELSAQAETYARMKKRQSLIAASLMWRAVAARWDGDERLARQFYERAFAIQNRLNTPTIAAHPGAIVYHQSNEEWNDALRVCQAELRVLRKHRQLFRETKLRLKKCELLKLAGRDWTREIERTRKVARELKSRDYWVAKLDALI